LQRLLLQGNLQTICRHKKPSRVITN
jgi:hypothetical protein